MKATYQVQDNPEKYQIDFGVTLDIGVTLGSRGEVDFSNGEITDPEIIASKKHRIATDALNDFVKRIVEVTQKGSL